MEGTLGTALRRDFDARRERNRAYSLRAFARDLGVSHSYLSLLLREKRRPSLPRLAAFARRLGWSDEERARFTTMAPTAPPPPLAARKPPARYVSARRDQYRILAEWWHLPVLDLTTLDDLDADPTRLATHIAERLGLTPARVRASLRLLARLDLVDDRPRKKNKRVYFPAAGTRAELRRYHARMIARSLAALRSGRREDFLRRDVTAMTFAAAPEKLDEARAMIRKFRRRLRAFLADGRCTELYQLNVQLFPLTCSRRRRKR